MLISSRMGAGGDRRYPCTMFRLKKGSNVGLLRKIGLPQNRSMSRSPLCSQYEALGVLVDAAERAEEEIEQKAKDGKRRVRRALRPEKRDGKGENGSSKGSSGQGSGGGGSTGGSGPKWGGPWRKRAQTTIVKAAETAVIMTSGLAMLGLAGLLYHRAYGRHSLSKMDDALDAWDPVLQMSIQNKKLGDDEDWSQREQQKLVDDVVSGDTSGRYWILLGEKGTGKTSMVLHAVQRVHGDNVVIMDAHADPEIFRQRLGKALNFEFHEDYWGGLFSLRGPRENTFLDIERVFNVLEQVALRRFHRNKKPLCVIINNAHLIPEDGDGNKVLMLLQQKAESFSGSGIANFLFTSDDYWLYHRMARMQTRMDTISVSDLSKPEALQVMKRLRKRITGKMPSDEECNAVYWLVGGRPQHIAAVAGRPDMIYACQHLIDREKQWFLNCCGLLGADMDDDVMDSGKFATSGMLLAREFVKIASETESEEGSLVVPRIPLWRARQIMTRPDFIQDYDNLNLFTLDASSRVKPDSVVMMHAFSEIVNLPGFDELLQATIDRVSAIESLQRTRELTFKDLGGGDSPTNGALLLKNTTEGLRIELEMPLPEDEEDDNQQQFRLDSSERYYWKRRIRGLNKPNQPSPSTK